MKTKRTGTTVINSAFSRNWAVIFRINIDLVWRVVEESPKNRLRHLF